MKKKIFIKSEKEYEDGLEEAQELREEAHDLDEQAADALEKAEEIEYACEWYKMRVTEGKVAFAKELLGHMQAQERKFTWGEFCCVEIACEDGDLTPEQMERFKLLAFQELNKVI